LLLIIGTVMGAVAGYFGGWIDLAISRLIEVFLCIPAFPLILMVSAFIDPEIVPPIFSIVVIIALIRWTGVARLVRAEFLRLREAEFAVAAKALGFSSRRTIFRHILPNAFAPALVAGAFAVASGILTESTLSFLGFGIRPPVASWGSLINETKAPEFWWMQVFPGLLIFITITCYNQVGDAIRDAVDPKMKKN
jgi:peptide/nickel transport system permease protein